MSVFEGLLKMSKAGKITDEQFGQLASIAADLQGKFRTSDCREIVTRLTSSQKLNESKTTAVQVARMAERKQKYYTAEDIMMQLDIFRKYPFVVLDTFFSHPNEEDVIFKSGSYSFTEKLPIVLYDLLPGCFTSRFKTPYKVRSGTLTLLSGDVYAANELATVGSYETVAEISERHLPSDYPVDTVQLPADRKTLQVLKPRVLTHQRMPSWWWDQTAPGVWVCPRCSRVPDGDEMDELATDQPFCPNCVSTPPVPLARTQTVPETFAKSWYAIKSGNITNIWTFFSNSRLTGNIEPALTIKPPYFARSMFATVGFSDELEVIHFYYGIERRYSGASRIATNPISIYFRYNGRPVAFGSKIQTDGLVFELNDHLLRDFVERCASEPSKTTLVQFIYYVVRASLHNDIGFFGRLRVFKTLLAYVLERNSFILPGNAETIGEDIKSLIEQPKVLESRLQTQEPSVPPDQISALLQAVSENASQITALNIETFKLFLKDQLVHSLAHALLDALQEISGSSEHGTGYFYNLEENKIYIFDAVQGGSGFSECARDYFNIPYTYRNAVIRQRLGRFDTSPTFLPTQDYLTLLENSFFECPDYITYRIMFQAAKSVNIKDLVDLMTQSNRRVSFIRELRNKCRSLLAEQGPLIEYNLRMGLPIMFKLLQDCLGIRSYEDMYALSLVPELAYDRLADVASDQIAKVLRHGGRDRRIEEVRELLALCYASCPNCSQPSQCINGQLDADLAFSVNQRLSNGFYQYAIQDLMIRVDDPKSDFLKTAQEKLLTSGSVLLSIDSSMGYGPIYPLVGIRDGTEYRVKVENDEDVVYPTANLKTTELTPEYEKICFKEGVVSLPFRILAKIELS